MLLKKRLIPLLLVNIVIVSCNDPRHNFSMIKSFRHKGVQLFFETGSKAKIQAAHAKAGCDANCSH